MSNFEAAQQAARLPSVSEAFARADYDAVVAELAPFERSIAGDILLARAYIRMGRFTDADEVLTTSRGARRPRLITLRAAAATRSGNAAAARSFLDIVARLPKTPEEESLLRYERALLAWSEGNVDEANELLNGPFHSVHAAIADELRGAVLIARGRYAEGVKHLERAFSCGDTWTVIHAAEKAAYIAREMYLPAVMDRIEAVAKTVTPTPYITDRYFQVVRSSAWFLVIRGEREAALKRLRRAEAFVSSAAWRVAVLIDRAYVSLVHDELLNGWEQAEHALEIARSVEWEKTQGEERRVLLYLTMLLADRNVIDARWCLRKYFSLKATTGISTAWSRDPRSDAFEAFARGSVARAEGAKSVANAEFAAAFRGFRDCGYDWRALMAFLAREPSGYSQGVADNFVHETLRKFPNSWLRAMAESQVSIQAAHPSIAGLTPMQREVLAWLASGLSNKAIAKEIGRSPKTVAMHVTSILRALKCDTRQQLQRFCSEVGFAK